jgi:hypothetical protein
MLFVALTSRLELNTLHSLAVAVQAHQLSSGDSLFIIQYLNLILVDNEVSHSVEITSWKRYLNFFTV